VRQSVSPPQRIHQQEKSGETAQEHKKEARIKAILNFTKNLDKLATLLLQLLDFLKKACFQQYTAISLLICLRMWVADYVLAWKNRKKTIFNNVLLLGS
jgi:hypothetical protein